MTIFNTVLNQAFRFLLLPFEGFSPWVGLVMTSLLTAIFMLLVFRRTSNQEALGVAKQKIHAGLFEMRLYQDDLRALFSAQRDILRHNLTYLRHTLKPLAWMILPLMLILVQLNFRYAFRSLEAGETAIVRVKFKGPLGAVADDIRLQSGDGLRIETPALRISREQEVDWRIRAVEAGTHTLIVKVGEKSVAKRIRVESGLAQLSPRRVSAGLESFLYPSEPALPDETEIEFIEVSYPEMRLPVLGYDCHWMIPFFVLSMVFAFALRRPFKVVI